MGFQNYSEVVSVSAAFGARLSFTIRKVCWLYKSIIVGDTLFNEWYGSDSSFFRILTFAVMFWREIREADPLDNFLDQ